MHWEAFTLDIALLAECFFVSFFSWPEGHFCVLEVDTGRPKEVPNTFQLKRDVPGRKRGPIKKGRVAPHTTEGGSLHSDLVSASPVKSQQRAGRRVSHLCSHSGSCLMAAFIESSTHRTREDAVL